MKGVVVRSVLESLLEPLQAVAAEWKLPGMVVAFQRGNGPVEGLAFGADGAGAPLQVDSILHMASITKPATALAVLRLVARGQLDLDAPLAEMLPDAAMAQPGVTLRRLLSHTAGAPLDVDGKLAPYAPGLDWAQLTQALLHAPPLVPPGRQVLYSNLGPGLAALCVERATGLAFAQALRELVLAPLGVEAWLGDEPPRAPAWVGGQKGRHVGTELESFNSRFWRSLAMPWAGMVTTAAGAMALVRAFGPGGEGFLPATLRADATSNQTGDLGGGFSFWREWRTCAWGLGVELRGDKQPHYAGACAPESWGHLGGSGAFAWHDPTVDLTWFVGSPMVSFPWADAIATAGDLIRETALTA